MSRNEQTILIVDDDPIILKSLRDLLAVRGYATDTAIGGKEAICQLDQKEYDLVLLDLHMPYVSGHDVMKHIGQSKQSPAVIIVSGETSFEAARNACSQGAYDFLRKPYATDELKALNEKALKAGIPIMMEVGLDPGIDHMSAMRVIDRIKKQGGTLLDFKSFCGGLVAPACDDNPWHYKFSWNPRNVVVAGQGVAKYKEAGQYKYVS